MDRSKAKALVDGALLPMRRALGLWDWTINVEYGPISDRRTDGGPGLFAGMCKSDFAYRHATIWIDHDASDGEAGLLRTLRHELLHITHAGFWVMVKVLEGTLPEDSPHNRAIMETWVLGSESLVRTLENLLDNAGMTPAKLIGLGGQYDDAKPLHKHRGGKKAGGAARKARKR